MSYRIGPSSRRELGGVHPDLTKVVEHAILITTQDFGVHDGLRLPREQKLLVATGASTTLNSKHLPQVDGYGHAVDLVPYVNGKLRWEWPLIYPIAYAMQTAARDHGVKIVWGGVWDRILNELPRSPAELKLAVDEYCVRHPGRDFIDGPHYQLA